MKPSSNQNTLESDKGNNSQTEEPNEISLLQKANNETSKPDAALQQETNSTTSGPDAEESDKLQEPLVICPTEEDVIDNSALPSGDNVATTSTSLPDLNRPDTEIIVSGLTSPKKSIQRGSEIYQKLTKIFAYSARNQRQPFTSKRNVPPPPQYNTAQFGQSARNQINQNNQNNAGMTSRQQGQTHQFTVPAHVPISAMAMFPNILTEAARWATYPNLIPQDIPTGLGLLINCDVLFVIQQMDLISLMLDIPDPNLYLVVNKRGECVYYVRESYSLCAMCSNTQSYRLHVMDIYHTEVMLLNLPCARTHCFCCYPILETYSPPGIPLGAIYKIYNLSNEVFNIVDSDENIIYKMIGSNGMRLGSRDFIIQALDSKRTQVGFIRREFVSMGVSLMTDLDYYGISFPENMDARLKAIFLSAVFIIDYSYYETRLAHSDYCFCCCLC